ncbi:ABC transporter ATP-binding protein [uncultured Maricaulis sp.]|jgi:iron complex transport system ATP-binding protein|uniref:ABC transporter ATP-binding protein n=1 Tax=uncultured Maricaulis sp. TaxID=174710 RepID=UPI0030D8B319
MSVLTLDQLRFQPGTATLFDQLSLTISGAGLVALVGPNGAGKSSLLRLLAGLVGPNAGHVRLDGHSLSDMDERERARAIAYLPPEGRAAWPISVRRLVALGRIPHLKPLRTLTPDDQSAIEAALARTGTAHLAERGFDTLSSGEKARVLLARTLAVGARIILLDEPMAALDVRHQLAVMEILAAEARTGALVIVSLHALDLAARHADRVVVLDNGQVVADGPPDRALVPAVLEQTFGVVAPEGLTVGGLRLPS